MSYVEESLEDLFKSELEDLDKGMKGKKRKGAHKLGNEPMPSAGEGAAGKFLKNKRVGGMGPTVERNASERPKPRTGVIKSLFPVADHFQAVHYVTDSSVQTQEAVGEQVVGRLLKDDE